MADIRTQEALDASQEAFAPALMFVFLHNAVERGTGEYAAYREASAELESMLDQLRERMKLDLQAVYTKYHTGDLET